MLQNLIQLFLNPFLKGYFTYVANSNPINCYYFFEGLFDLLGFNCNVMCQSSEPVVESLLSDDNSTTTTTTTATTESTTEATTTTTTTTSTNSLLNGINQVQLLESAKLEENLKSSLNQNLGNLG